jgi:hypothetical protein
LEGGDGLYFAGLTDKLLSMSDLKAENNSGVDWPIWEIRAPWLGRWQILTL